MKIKISYIQNILEWIIAFFAVIECNSVYSILLPKAIFFSASLLPLLLLIVMNIKYNKKRTYRFFGILLALSYLLFLIIMFMNVVNPTTLLFRFGIAFPLFILLFSTYGSDYNKISIFNKISTIIYYQAICSLVFWLLVSVLKILPTNMALTIEWGDAILMKGFLGLYFEAQITAFAGIDIIRNSSIYAEAPMYNFILCFGLIIEILFKRRLCRNRIIILSVTIISTISTTGYILLLLLWGGFFYLKKTNNKFFSILKFISVPIISIVLYFLINILILEKKNNTDSGSYETRSTQIVEGIKKWEKNPIMGAGYGASSVGSSNSLFVILEDGGLVLLSVYIVPFIIIPFLISVKMKKYNYIIASIFIFYLFSITIVYFSNIIFIYLSFWYSVSINKRNNIALL